MRNLNDLAKTIVENLEANIVEFGYSKTIDLFLEMEESELAEFTYGLYRAMYYTEYNNYTLH